MFREEKTAQMAAYLLSKEGGRMSAMKLMCLLYLSDRESMDRFGVSMTGDRMISLPRSTDGGRTMVNEGNEAGR